MLGLSTSTPSLGISSERTVGNNRITLPSLPFMQKYGPDYAPGDGFVHNQEAVFKDDVTQLDLDLDHQPRVTDDQAVGEIRAVRDSKGTLFYIDEEYNIVIPSAD